MQPFYSVLYQYADKRYDHFVEFENLKKAKADIDWVGSAPDSLETPRPNTATLRADGRIIGRYQWPKSGTNVVEAYFDFPSSLLPAGKTAKNAFKSMFEQWAVEVRRGMDLSIAATMIGGSYFWNMLHHDMLYPRTIESELVKNLSYGEDTVFVRFHVLKPSSNDVWFSC